MSIRSIRVVRAVLFRESSDVYNILDSWLNDTSVTQLNLHLKVDRLNTYRYPFLHQPAQALYLQTRTSAQDGPMGCWGRSLI